MSSKTRLRIVLGVVALLAGFLLLPAVRSRLPGRGLSAADWERQILADSHTALQVLAPDPRLPAELPEEFWAEWRPRIAEYDDAHRAELRRRLGVYLDFLLAEYADAAEIYTSAPAVTPGEVSDSAAQARAEVTECFGHLAETLLEQGNELREEAFRAAPNVAGFDPDLPDYRQEYARIRELMPRARARADALTEAP